jgi:putative FmdB family regulatory protein
MPTYEYLCEKCNVVREHVSHIEQRPESLPCPKCGKPAYQAVLTAPAVATSGMSQAPLDVVIGRDAEARWSDIRRRQEDRDKVRRESGKEAVQMTGRNEFKPIDGNLQFVETPEPTED